MKGIRLAAAHMRCVENGSFSSWDSGSDYAWKMYMNGDLPDGASVDLPF
jgi:hypothetical protein